MESDKGNDNDDVFTSLLVMRGRLNATTTNAKTMTTTMTTTTTITSSNANANAANENKYDGRKYRDRYRQIPCNCLPKITRDG